MSHTEEEPAAIPERPRGGKGSVRSLWRLGWPFVALCGLVSSRWLIEGFAPGTGSTSFSEAAGCAMAAGVAALPHGFRRSRSGQTGVGTLPWEGVVAGVLVLSGAALGAGVSDRHVSGNNATLAMCLTPVVIAVALPASEASDGEEVTARLWPGLVGLAALLLLLPQPEFTGWRFAMALCLMPLLTGLGAVFAAPRSSRRTDGREFGAAGVNSWLVVVLAASAAVFAVKGLAELRSGGVPLSAAAVGLDALTSLLSLLVLWRLGPTRWAAQFLAVPLATMLEGAILLRPVLDVRSWLGFVLLAIATGYLLLIGGRRQAFPSRFL